MRPFHTYGVLGSYMDFNGLQVTNSKEEVAILTIPDLLNTKIYYPHPKFDNAVIAIINDWRYEIKMTHKQFEDMLQEAQNKELFSRISLN